MVNHPASPTPKQNKLETGARGNAMTLAYSYKPSKRTKLYASYAKLDNNNLAAFRLFASTPSVVPPAAALGSDPTALTVGVRRHSNVDWPYFSLQLSSQ
jgi:predicted porin